MLVVRKMGPDDPDKQLLLNETPVVLPLERHYHSAPVPILHYSADPHKRAELINLRVLLAKSIGLE